MRHVIFGPQQNFAASALVVEQRRAMLELDPPGQGTEDFTTAGGSLAKLRAVLAQRGYFMVDVIGALHVPAGRTEGTHGSYHAGDDHARPGRQHQPR